MNYSFHDGHDDLYHHASLGKIAQCCRCENVVFVSFVCCHASSPEQRAFERCIVRTSIALPFIVRFRRGLHLHYIYEVYVFALHNSHFRR